MVYVFMMVLGGIVGALGMSAICNKNKAAEVTAAYLQGRKDEREGLVAYWGSFLKNSSKKEKKEENENA